MFYGFKNKNVLKISVCNQMPFVFEVNGLFKVSYIKCKYINKGTASDQKLSEGSLLHELTSVHFEILSGILVDIRFHPYNWKHSDTLNLKMKQHYIKRS